MSWQTDLFEQLRNREWHTLGDLFERYEQDIPLHFATRHYVSSKHTEELPSNFEARWIFFRFIIRRIGIEREDKEGPRKSLAWNTRIRLGYVNGRTCHDCGGPVIRASWSGTTTSCLNCGESAPEPEPVVPEPEPVVPEPEPVVPEPEPKSVKPKNTTDEVATLSSLKEVWTEFLLNHPNAEIDKNRKLRWILHRAQEAGATKAYLWVRPRLASNWTWGDIVTQVELRGADWITTKTPMLTNAERDNWYLLLRAAYRYAEMTIISIAFAGRLHVIQDEIAKLVAKLPPPPPPKPAPKQRWRVLKHIARWRFR